MGPEFRFPDERNASFFVLPQCSAMSDRAGIDPYNLLDWEQGDSIEGLKIGGPQ